MTSNILLIGAAIGSILFTMSAEASEVCTKVINGKAVASAQCQAGRDANDQLNSHDTKSFRWSNLVGGGFRGFQVFPKNVWVDVWVDLLLHLSF